MVKDKLKNYKSAISDYDKVITIEFNNADAHYYRGLDLSFYKNYQNAIKDISQAIKIRNDHSYAYADRGWIKALLNQFKNAINDCNKAILINPKNEKHTTIEGGYMHKLKTIKKPF